MKATAALMHGALADCRCELDDVIADDDRVAVRYTTRARHVGELFGAAPSGRTVTFTGIEVFRVLDSKIVEYWGEANMSELFASSADTGARDRELTLHRPVVCAHYARPPPGPAPAHRPPRSSAARPARRATANPCCRRRPVRTAPLGHRGRRCRRWPRHRRRSRPRDPPTPAPGSCRGCRPRRPTNAWTTRRSASSRRPGRPAVASRRVTPARSHPRYRDLRLGS